MSGGSTQQQQASSSNTINPQSMAMLQGNYATAQGNAASLTPYTGQLTAGFTPTQTQAQGVLAGVATDPTYAANNNAALSSVQGVLGNPVNGTVTAAPTSASTYDPSQLANTDLSPYLNPYTSDVIDTTNNQIGLQRQTAQTQDAAQATAANAFGGSRSGVMGALTNQLYDQDTASTDAGLNQANYSQAQTAAEGDVSAQNAAKAYNATNTQNTGQFNSSQNLTAQQQSITNALAAQGITLNAAGQAVSTNNNGLALAQQQGGVLSAVGDAQQQQQQAQLTAAYNAYTQGQQLTVEQQQLLNSALGLVPVQQTTNSTGSGSTTTNPGAAGILGGLGSLAQGAAMLG